MANKAVIPFLVGMMLLTGVCNTLLTKYQDMQCVHNCSSPDPADRKTFEQPVWQTAQMFVGEMGCWLVVGISALYTRFSRPSKGSYQPLSQTQSPNDDTTDPRNSTEEAHPTSNPDVEVEPAAKPLALNAPDRKPLHGWRVILLALPSTCDILGTTLMNIGLLYVAASIYQMTRGALVLFVGLFSVLFLGRHLSFYKWFALFVVVAGVAIVGLAGAIEQRDAEVPSNTTPDNEATIPSDLLEAAQRMVRRVASEASEPNRPTPAVLTIVGVLLIALAQVFTASQFVIEEAIMHRYTLTPLSVVGWEGVFGLIVTLVAMLIGDVAYGRARPSSFFNARAGWAEMTQNPAIAVSSILIMISIGGFNFFGLSVTRSVSATSRSTIDTCRTLFIWVVSLGLGWETFKWLQVLGFAGLVYGTFLFNEIVRPPSLRWLVGRRRGGGGEEELLPERPIEHN